MNIFGKNIVCVLSGGNNDITRYPDFIEKDLVYQGIKHYYIINFNQKKPENLNYLLIKYYVKEMTW